MKACGVIVEYNPFHNGHVYHIQESQKAADADCMIAVMSGNFLQRGEPAIIDKFHRTKAALSAGIDIVLELPYAYAVQSSDLFTKGSVQTLNEIGVSSICFGSESGDVSHFKKGFERFVDNENTFRKTLKEALGQGLSFPEASRMAYQEIGLAASEMDLSRPNNILGFGYVKTILENNLPIEPLTIKRTNSNYHDQNYTGTVASATSIRKELLADKSITPDLAKTMPAGTTQQLDEYKQSSGIWHDWELYFPILQYRVKTMTTGEIAMISGVDEGLEHRIKRTANEAISFVDWMGQIKTKRYTWTRLQRIFVHLLTNTKKNDLIFARKNPTVPFVRLLGMTAKGQSFLNVQKKRMEVPLISNLNRTSSSLLYLEEKADNAYYSVLATGKQKAFHDQELNPPIITQM
ncbi:nucleotidyltransferase [Virgibacillus siamensis]|uniref:nucleotidyltransferase n=1 Tax=Virgibacillus siamensis TaxID=480071 RepID=UPI0009861CB6|nr:nucleotidyltransferase [Virgibacillus siamensis]